MKFRIVATIVMLAILFLLYAMFSGSSDSSTVPVDAPISLEGY